MLFFARPEARERRTCAERPLLEYQRLTEHHPSVVPELQPGYRATARAMANRIFIPNVEIDGSRVRLTTPKAYRTPDAIGLMAVRSGEKIFLDEWFGQPTGRQREDQRRFLARHATHESPFDVTQASRAGLEKDATEPIAFGPDNCGLTMRPEYKHPSPFTHKETAETFGYAAFRGKPSLFVSTGYVFPLILAHEIEHAIQSDTGGVQLDDPTAEKARSVVDEQRAYYVESEMAEYCLEHGVNVPGLQESYPFSGEIDSVRRAHLGDGPRFGYSRQMVADYVAQGVLGAMV